MDLVEGPNENGETTYFKRLLISESKTRSTLYINIFMIFAYIWEKEIGK